jgi:hypothetical protein
MGGERAPVGPASEQSAAPGAAATPRGASMDQAVGRGMVLGLQTSAGNRAVAAVLARATPRSRTPGAVARPPAPYGRSIARVPAAMGLQVSPHVQEACAPILSSLKVNPGADSPFYRGEWVQGEIAVRGGAGAAEGAQAAAESRPATIIFLRLEGGRLRAGIFSINVSDKEAAVRAFGDFRGTSRQLARALEVPELELMGAAVANKDIEAMLQRQGLRSRTRRFHRSSRRSRANAWRCTRRSSSWEAPRATPPREPPPQALKARPPPPRAQLRPPAEVAHPRPRNPPRRRPGP